MGIFVLAERMDGKSRLDSRRWLMVRRRSLPEKLWLLNGADMFAVMDWSGVVGSEELLHRSGPGENSG